MNPGAAGLQAPDSPFSSHSGRVVLIGDHAADLTGSAEQLRSFGIGSIFVDPSLDPADPAPTGSAEPDILIVKTPFSRGELIEYLEISRADLRRARIKTVVLTRFQSAVDRRRLIMVGAHYLLAFPVDPQVLLRVVRAALEDLATSDSIQDFVSSHKSGSGRMLLGVFEIRTFEEAQKLSSMLAMNYPSPEEVAIGIWELLCNAIEHGNLEIDFNEKLALLSEGRFEQEVQRRLSQPPFASRSAIVQFRCGRKAIRLRVTDQGPGFDFKRFLGADPPVNTPNGRGIFIAEKLCFDQLRYRGCGNIVEAVVKLSEPLAEGG